MDGVEETTVGSSSQSGQEHATSAPFKDESLHSCSYGDGNERDRC